MGEPRGPRVYQNEAWVELRRRALALFVAGASGETIGEDLGVSPTTARKWIRQAELRTVVGPDLRPRCDTCGIILGEDELRVVDVLLRPASGADAVRCWDCRERYGTPDSACQDPISGSL